MSDLQVKNDGIIAAPVATLWAIITDIRLLPQINPSITRAEGVINRVDGTRICQLTVNGIAGESTETITAFVAGKSVCWKVDGDTFRRLRMLKGLRYCIRLERVDLGQTKVFYETYYKPGNFLVQLLNFGIIRRKISAAQERMIANLRILAI